MHSLNPPYPELAQQSQSLSAAIKRSFNPELFPLLAKAYCVAVRCGGGSELDFERPAGQSFNPRPARIALILLNDAQTRSAPLIAAAMLSTASEQLLSIAALKQEFPSEVLQLLMLSRKSVHTLIEKNDEDCREAALIALASWLDRSRHLHLASGAQTSELWAKFYSDTDDFIELATAIESPLAELLISFKERFSRRL